MAKKKDEAPETGLKFSKGGTLADGTTFEAGDLIPASVSESELAALREMEAIEEEV